MIRLAIFVVIAGCHHAPDPAPPPPPPGHAPASHSPPGRVVVADTDIQFLEPIRFEGQSATITLESLPTLDAIAATMIGNPSIKLVEVQAFGADGPAQFQEVIGDQRARAVVDALVKRGVEPKRLRPAGLAKPVSGTDLQPVFEIIQRD